MSWCQPKRKNTHYNHRLVWGNDNDIRFFIKPHEQQKNPKTPVETTRKDCKPVKQEQTNKKEKQKKTEEKPINKKKIVYRKETTKNKIKKQKEKQSKTKISKKAPASGEKVTRDNFI